MRGIRISVSLTLAIGLLAAPAVGVAAQDSGACPWTAIGVSGKLVTKNVVVVQEPSSEVVDGVPATLRQGDREREDQGG